jgi:hypothetical protein
LDLIENSGSGYPFIREEMERRVLQLMEQLYQGITRKNNLKFNFCFFYNKNTVLLVLEIRVEYI